jgi:prepilin-type N-terminal cleavage/methylation domain-containing protein
MGLSKSRIKNNGGFTLIELMLTIAIIAILASIAISKFADLVRKANEGATKAGLGEIRSAMSIYISDNEGAYPAQMGYLAPYISTLPKAYVPPYHQASSFNKTLTYSDPTIMTISQALAEYGGSMVQIDNGYYFWLSWTPNGPFNSAGDVQIFTNCTHTDSKGTIWTTY